jgi:cellulose synthase/poly-beta-1,6-N-acetylglucosamine synthase-like glycosyltransferase
MLIFYFFAALVVLQSLVSLRGGLRWFALFRRELEARRPLYMPRASVVVPCRGVDQGLRENLDALFAQHYPSYEIVFVSDRADDPALAVAEKLSRELGGEGASIPRPRFVVAGRASGCGQKVHNLRAAVAEADASSEVFVFVDTDARPRADWLRALVAPLEDARIGAATGYRWFLPVRGGLASHLRSVWNASIASALGQDDRRNFCWGGSTAIRRETFERLNIRGRWRGAASDDYALTRALQEAELPIRFVPACLTASLEDCTLAGLLEFTTRQLKITRVYAPHLWRFVLASNLLFVLVFFGGLALVAARAALGLGAEWPMAIVSVVFLLGVWKSFFRLRAVALALEDRHAELRAGLWAHLLLWPLTAVLFLYNALAAARSRRILWRGIEYELKSPEETVIIRDAAAGDDGPARARQSTLSGGEKEIF